MNRLSNIRSWTFQTFRDPKIGLGLGLGLSALAGAPLPFSQVSLLGPFIATCAVGAIGGRAAAAVEFVAYLALGNPTPVSALTAALLAFGVAWGVPKLVEQSLDTYHARLSDGERGASAVVIDCEGFSALDNTYGPGTSTHVFNLLHRALKTETREVDLVVHSQGQELMLVLDGSSPAIAQAVMTRVERRFSNWLSDAGYDCNLSMGLSGAVEPEAEIDDLMRSAYRANGEPYLD